VKMDTFTGFIVSKLEGYGNLESTSACGSDRTRPITAALDLLLRCTHVLVHYSSAPLADSVAGCSFFSE